MIDFKNGSLIKLRKIKDTPHDLEALLIEGEDVISTYKGVRDYVTFTTKRIISCNAQGMTGKKKDYTTLPYSKVQAFSVETAGNFDLDCELELYFSSIGKVKFEFTGTSDIVAIGKLISQYIL